MFGISNKKINKELQYFFVCLFFSSLNFEMFSPIWENFSVSKMSAILYIISYILDKNNKYEISNIKTEFVCLILMQFFIVFSSVINNSNKIFDVTLFLNFIMFWFLINHNTVDNRVFENGLFWFCVFSSVIGCFYMLGIGVSVSEITNRISMFGDNENSIGIKMSVSIIYLVNYTMNNFKYKKIYKPYLLLMILPMISLLVATASRVAFLSLVMGLLVFMIFRPTNKNKKIWYFFSIIIIFVFVI